MDLSKWPKEPPSPDTVDVKRFEAALLTLCGWLSPKQKRRYTKWILASAAEFEVDPFLLAVVAYRQSRCQRRQQSDYGVGLTAIHLRMHQVHVRKRTYHFHVWRDASWQAETLPMPRFKFRVGNLRRAEPNLYFAAALMAVARAQCPHNDGAFGSVPHRHWISHFYWGDRVLGAGAEDRALEARRRLLQLYEKSTEPPRARFGDLPLASPLDGWPRKVSSGFGADRDEGSRRHMGIDFLSAGGEPVRAIAAGRVVLAGVQKRKGTFSLPPEEAVQVPRSQMAPGGLLVMIRHPGDLKSAYMHLSRYVVTTGQRVEAGQLLGYIGRSGMRRSPAHLHFELRHEGRHVDPFPHLAPYLFGPKETWLGRRVEREERRQRRVRRKRRRRR